ncbi:MAG: lipoyl(octanoyl) transferase LipB [Rickettsia endosymbiont of Bryobia graminum]|nr:lipoyl(octanoyl) transferase LipB [Rickettsia endosymbiont of Bryobia graminum]
MHKFITLPGLLKYQDAAIIMENKVNDVINNPTEETIYLVEHQDVYTAGTSHKDYELLNSRHIPVVYTGRGGKFTYHGPGQRVIYPILNLSLEKRKKDLKLYIGLLEKSIISSLSDFGVQAFTMNDAVGVWVTENNRPAKIASIGVRVKKWVTYHGIAINISTDLDKFSGIIACGLKDVPVTSLNKLGIDISFTQFDEVIKNHFNRIF